MGYALKLLPKASDEGIHLKHEQTPVYSIPPPPSLPATNLITLDNIPRKRRG